jgi:hypothetical protein
MRKRIACAGVALTLLACRSDKPEDQVRKRFEACRAAVEAGDAAAASAPLDPAFRGPDGMDKATAQLFLMGTLRQDKVGVTVVRNEVAAKGNEAFQDVDLILTGRDHARGGALLPEDASRRSFRLRWLNSGGEWRLVELQSL